MSKAAEQKGPTKGRQRRTLVEWPPPWVIGALAIAVAGPDIANVVPERAPRNPERIVKLAATTLTPFHHALAEAGRWDISKETAALVPKSFNAAAAFLETKTTPGPPLWYSGIHRLDVPKGGPAPTRSDDKGVRELRADAERILPGKQARRGAAYIIRLDGTKTATFDSHVIIRLFEIEDDAGTRLVVQAYRSDGSVFYPLDRW